jgi:hypothetical protein
MRLDFAVFGINGKTNTVGCLHVTDNRALAESKAEEATRSGWLLARPCSSPEELEQWKRDAREIIKDMLSTLEKRNRKVVGERK